MEGHRNEKIYCCTECMLHNVINERCYTTESINLPVYGDLMRQGIKTFDFCPKG